MDKEAKGVAHRGKNMIKGLSREGICVARMGKLSIVAKILAHSRSGRSVGAKLNGG